MTKSTRERNREKFLGMLERYQLTRAAAAELLHSSGSAVDAWCKPETSKSSNPVPMWAIELLEFKMAKKSAMTASEFAALPANSQSALLAAGVHIVAGNKIAKKRK